MARVPVRIYKHSVLASVISVFGSIMAMSGVCLIFSVPVGGIVCAVIGIAMLVLASSLADKKRFKMWVKDLEQKGILARLPASRDLCVRVYQANPQMRTVQMIAKYNPAVAQEILSALKK